MPDLETTAFGVQPLADTAHPAAYTHDEEGGRGAGPFGGRVLGDELRELVGLPLHFQVTGTGNSSAGQHLEQRHQEARVCA